MVKYDEKIHGRLTLKENKYNSKHKKEGRWVNINNTTYTIENYINGRKNGYAYIFNKIDLLVCKYFYINDLIKEEWNYSNGVLYSRLSFPSAVGYHGLFHKDSKTNNGKRYVTTVDINRTISIHIEEDE